MQPPLFEDRFHAGRILAHQLERYRSLPDLLVLGLPRGGVPVAFEVAKALAAPLDVFVVRKLGVPGHEELAMGALASGNVQVLNHDVLDQLSIPSAVVSGVAQQEQAELERREHLYRGQRPPLRCAKRSIILVDDGLATGATMRAAITALREQQPARLIVAVPVGAPEVCAMLRPSVDELICAATPQPLRAVGLWYANFGQTSDSEVAELLRASQEFARSLNA